ncbi:unnamed protein product [Fraxinus pennsylvanica]|uniref:Uncharacterized protein n=1 Tax=Fraxinus pennsylvanica TaxID=56036 RepID=A0AAD2DP87_9LAMI|nr:unnamed protein product [Fraxinus pennsylvanica]
MTNFVQDSGDSLEVGSWEVGESKGRKKKNGDVEVETGCWIKLFGRNPVSSCALVHSLNKQLNFVESLKVTFELCQILADHVRALLEQGNTLDCVDPNMGNYPEDEVLHVLKLALVCTSQVPSSWPSMAEVVQTLQVICTLVPHRLEGF